MIAFVKFVWNQYSTLHDLSIVIFFVLMNINLVFKNVEGVYFLFAGIFYGVCNTLFLWITWLRRFSGNANFFYFQIIAL